MNYGKRSCLVCGKEFEAAYPAQLACSRECWRKRKTAMNQRLEIAKRARTCRDLDWLNWRLERAIEAISKLDCENRLLHQRLMEIDGQDEAGNSGRGKPDKKTPPRMKREKAPSVPEQPSPERETREFQHRCVVCGRYFKSKFSEHDYCSDDCLLESSKNSLDNNPWNI